MQSQNKVVRKKIKNKNWDASSQPEEQINKPVLVEQKIAGKQKRYKDITQMQYKYSFNIQAIMGAGFASTVYLGERIDTHEMVCVKAIDLITISYSSQDKQLIHKEIEYLSWFDSDFIVKLYDVYESNTFYYLVMELCPGGDLYKMLKISPLNLPSDFVTSIIKQATSGLMEIQKRGLIHRDLKTQNLFVLRFPQAANQTIGVKIGDLGFCVSASQLQSIRQQGKVIQNVGSPIYMSPEVCQRQQYSFSSDIYSLGIIWYELYHKKAPWEALSQEQLLQKKLTKPVEIWREDIPPKIKTAISKCISNDPMIRPTCEELLKILQESQQKEESV